jgi:hypothetical protein
LKVSWKKEFVALWGYLQNGKVRNAQARSPSQADIH